MARTERREVKAQMRIFFRGNDKGNAVVTALVFIMVPSTICVSVIPRIISIKQYAGEYKAKVIRGIEKSNREVTDNYDFN